MTPSQQRLKRGCDIVVAVVMLTLCFWLIAVMWVAATIQTGRNGMFTQQRVGMGGRRFAIYKIRTMRETGSSDTVTISDDPRITSLGALLRRTKLDELPQLMNVLIGDMSLVGPRPDTAEYAAFLDENDLILTVRPGLTGPATLLFIDEQDLLARLDDPYLYNRKVIFPAKVAINRHYVSTYSFRRDIGYLVATLFPPLRGPALAEYRALLESRAGTSCRRPRWRPRSSSARAASKTPDCWRPRPRKSAGFLSPANRALRSNSVRRCSGERCRRGARSGRRSVRAARSSRRRERLGELRARADCRRGRCRDGVAAVLRRRERRADAAVDRRARHPGFGSRGLPRPLLRARPRARALGSSARSAVVRGPGATR